MTETAAHFIINPPVDDYAPALDALIETILPIGAGFPLDRETVLRRLLRMFPLENERKFLGVQKTLLYFDALDLAPHVAPPLLQSERIAVDSPARISESEFRSLAERKSDSETRACDAFFATFGNSRRRFSDLLPEGRAAWLNLWAASEFTVKRDFARSMRAMIFASAWSCDRAWAAIGYEGPLVGGPERNES